MTLERTSAPSLLALSRSISHSKIACQILTLFQIQESLELDVSEGLEGSGQGGRDPYGDPYGRENDPYGRAYQPPRAPMNPYQQEPPTRA